MRGFFCPAGGRGFLGVPRIRSPDTFRAPKVVARQKGFASLQAAATIHQLEISEPPGDAAPWRSELLDFLKKVIGSRKDAPATPVRRTPPSPLIEPRPKTVVAVDAETALRNIERHCHASHGVPLDDIAGAFAAIPGYAVGFSGKTLVLRNGQLRTYIRAVRPPEGAPVGVEGNLEVRTNVDELFDRLQAGQPKVKFNSQALSELNAMTVSGALAEESGHFYVCSRFSFHEGEGSWNECLLPLADDAARFSAESIIGAIAEEKFSDDSGLEGSAWGEADFVRLASALPKGTASKTAPNGLVAAVRLGGGDGKAAGFLRRLSQIEATLSLSSTVPHPYLGDGLFVRLDLPNHFGSERVCRETAGEMNRFEMEGRCDAPHFGAWCTGDGRTLSYLSFLRNGLRKYDGLDESFLLSGISRARWAYAELRRLGFR